MSIPYNEDPLLGQQVANFRLERVIGRGGMATVYFGTDIKLNRPVAVKVIDARYRDQPAYAERFVRESQIVATWRHPNILQIYYADDQEDLYYFVMEYVDGLDLRRLVDMYKQDDQVMPVEDVLRIGYAVGEALDYAHAKGVIHRDIKPSNVMVAYNGRVLLADFGLAMQVTEGSMGEVFGTPHYMAPEQARRSADAVPQSDLYSLGVLLYEMLTGHVPFDDESPTSVALMHLTEPPPAPREYNPDLNEATEAVLVKALAKKPAARYQSGGAMIRALHRALLGVADENYALPPLPALVRQYREQPAGAIEPDRKFLTLAERLALHAGSFDFDRPTEPLAENKVSNSATRVQPRHLRPGFKKSAGRWGAALISLAGLLALVLWFGIKDEAADSTAVPSPSSLPQIAAIATPLPTRTLPPPPQINFAPTATTDRAAALVEPTVTLTPSPSPSPSPTMNPPLLGTPVIVSDPDLLLVYSNPLAFYVINETERVISVNQLSFIAIDNDDNLTDYGFRGAQWGIVRIEKGKCNALELVQRRESIRPQQCRGFNWIDYPSEDSIDIFWHSRPSERIYRFQVFWAGQPIQTCAILSGSCAVDLP